MNLRVHENKKFPQTKNLNELAVINIVTLHLLVVVIFSDKKTIDNQGISQRHIPPGKPIYSKYNKICWIKCKVSNLPNGYKYSLNS